MPLQRWVDEVKIRLAEQHEGVLRAVSLGDEVAVVLGPLDAEAASGCAVEFTQPLFLPRDASEVVPEGLSVSEALFAQG